MKKKISIIIAVYNNASHLQKLHDALKKLNDDHTYEYEHIFIDDGSTDTSWQKISSIKRERDDSKAIRFTRNFGQHAAFVAGYTIATGDALITIEGSLEDAPQIIEQLVKRWQEGFALVYTKSVDKNRSSTRSFFSRVYKKLCRSSDDAIDTSKLIDKKVLEALGTSYQHISYMQGLFTWTGFKHSTITYTQTENDHPHWKGDVTEKVNVLIERIIDLSSLPLKFSMVVGLCIIASSLFMLIYIIFDTLLYHKHYPLFKWVVVLICMCVGVSCTLLWLLGEYIGRIIQQQKNLPLYIITKKIVDKKDV